MSLLAKWQEKTKQLYLSKLNTDMNIQQIIEKRKSQVVLFDIDDNSMKELTKMQFDFNGFNVTDSTEKATVMIADKEEKRSQYEGKPVFVLDESKGFGTFREAMVFVEEQAIVK